MENKLIIEQNEKKVEFIPLIKVDMEDKEYIIYTKDEQNELGDTVCYVSTYNFKNGSQTLEPIDEENTLEFLDEILMHVQTIMNKKESSE